VHLVKRTALGLIILLLVVEGSPSPAQAPSEYAVKAAFLVKFIHYVEWPADGRSERAPFVVGVLGTDPFGNVLDEMLAEKQVNGRKIVARRFKRLEDAATGSSILFISSSEWPDLTEILRTMDRHPVLTVGEIDHFASRGGVIGFRLEGNKVRFDINAERADRAGLKVSSQLLKLARIVRTGEKS
jgi:hypothetical protein